MKLLINRAYGGYGVSNEAIELWFTKKGLPMRTEIDKYGDKRYYHDDKLVWSIDRTDPTLIEIFEEIGSKRTSGEHANLCLEELPDFAHYFIGEYDGQEWIDDTWIEVTIEELANGLSQEKLAMLQKVNGIRLQRNSQ
jgi:hypothetical protein